MTNPVIVACTLTLRTPAPNGDGYHYDTVPGAAFRTTCPPQIDDVIVHSQGVYRVVGRQWTVPYIGSASWPSTNEMPRESLLALVVEPSEGLFADEVLRTDDASNAGEDAA